MSRLLLFCLLLGACAPADRADSVRAWMYLRDPATNEYSLRIGEARNLKSLRELRGRDVVLRAATSISEGVGIDSINVDEGRAFAFDWSEDGDVVVPADQDSFQALTLYRHLDSVATLLRAHGHVPARPLTVYFLPRYENLALGDGRLLLTDNAAFMSMARGFLILPSFMLSNLPMLLNEGIVAHEFGHAVVHQEMFGDALEEPNARSTKPEWVIAGRHLLAMHEGVADIIGFVATGDPNFIRSTADVGRDMAEPRSLTVQMANELNTAPTEEGGLLPLDDFDPHEQGSTLARTIYELWPKDPDGKIGADERGRLLDVTLESLRALVYKPRAFTLASFPNEVVRRLTGSEKSRACDVLATRFAPFADEFTACEVP